MSTMTSWHPLTDLYETYQESVDTAVTEGFVDDPDLAEDYLWPPDLMLGAMEKDDIKKYVHERMTEIVESVQRNHGLDPNVLASIIFRTLQVGMMWERERYGR